MPYAQKGETAAIAAVVARLGAAPPEETWIGDDAAVLDVAGISHLLFSTDVLVDGVHFDRRWCSLADVGWKALTVNVSDIAAMGGSPCAAVVSVAGATVAEVEELYVGLGEAASRYSCPIVGGDLSSATLLSVSVAIVGSSGRDAVLRSGARPGDLLFVTGALGSSAAGLRVLTGDPGDAGALASAHRRPSARLAEGHAARTAGATAMIDLSDGLGLDLDRVARASGVGVALDAVPVVDGATLSEALGGGEDYELLFAAPDPDRVAATFAGEGLAVPIRIGRCVAEASIRSLAGGPLAAAGFIHHL